MIRIGPTGFRDMDPAPAVCRDCGKTMDACRALNSRERPTAGSVTVCFYCGEISVFEDDRHLREPTAEEMERIRADEAWPIIERAQALFREGRLA